MGAKHLTPEQRRFHNQIIIAIEGVIFALAIAAMFAYRGLAFRDFWGGLTVWALLSALSATIFSANAPRLASASVMAFWTPPLLIEQSKALQGKSWGEVTLLSAQLSGGTLALWIFAAIAIRLVQHALSLSKSPLLPDKSASLPYPSESRDGLE